MKRFVTALIVLTISLSASYSYGQYVSAAKGQTYKKNVGQTVSSSPKSIHTPNKFKTYEEAVAAYRSGNFSYYFPSDLRSYGKLPVDGVSRVLIPLEQDAVVQSPVVGGIYYVIMQTGSKFRWYKNSDGCVADTPYAIDACGNAVLFFKYITPERKEVAAEAPLNNYSERPIYNQPYKDPKDCNYNCNGYKKVADPYQPAEYKKKGWSTGKKIIVGVVVAVATYAIISYATKSKGGSESHEQVVITEGASFAPSHMPVYSSQPRNPGVGLAFGIRF